MRRAGGWESAGGVDPSGAKSWRGGLPYAGALRVALRDTSLGSHRYASVNAVNAGSGNVNTTIQVADYPGRGELPLRLDLVHNSRVWQRTVGISPPTSTMTFDIDHDWPAPGWSLGFGKMVSTGYGHCMLIAVDGSRRPSVQESSSQHVGGLVTIVERTTDGSMVEYSHDEQPSGNVLFSGLARGPEGTITEFGAPSADRHALFPISITDRNGNQARITYRGGSGPALETVTGPCGRVLRFYYDVPGNLVGVTGPGTGGEEVDLLRLHYTTRVLRYSFEPSFLIDAPDAVDLIDGLVLPISGGGYSFQQEGDYSTDGTLRRMRRCQGLTWLGGDRADAGQIQGGTATRVQEYDYPEAADRPLYDAPTYTKLTDTWAGQVLGPSVTTFQVAVLGAGSSVTIARPDGSRTTQTTDGAGTVSSLDVIDRAGILLQRTRVKWGPGEDAALRVERVAVTNGRGHEAWTSYSYAPDHNQVSEVLEYQDAGSTLARRTVTTYLTSADYQDRHLLELVTSRQVFDGRLGPVSRTDVIYDSAPLQPVPGLTGLDETFDPANHVWVPPHRERTENDNPPPLYVWTNVPGQWVGAYDARTLARGNPTTIQRYPDPASTAGMITTQLAYDLCGHLVRAQTGLGTTQWVYGAETRYSAVREVTTGASESGSAVRMSVAFAYDAVGLPTSVTDVNGLDTRISYDPSTFRPLQVFHPASGVMRTTSYDDAHMSQTSSQTDATGSLVSAEEITFDGSGTLIRSGRAGPNGEWKYVDYRADATTRTLARSAAHSADRPVQWSTSRFDALDRLLEVSTPDGGANSYNYDEVALPVRVNEDWATSTLRVVDAWGRQSWHGWDALGRLAAIVRPDAVSGDLSGPGATVSEYRYTGTTVELDSNRYFNGTRWRVEQARRLRRDGLGRVTAVSLPERGTGLSEDGTTTGNPRLWSIVWTYDEQGYLTSSKDSRGVRTLYDAGSDPLGRVHRRTYDLSDFADAANPVQPCPDVVTEYATTGDLTRLTSQTALGVCRRDDTYDRLGRLASRTITMAELPEAPFSIDYGYDSAGRLTTLTYPASYGDNTPHRPVVVLSYAGGGGPPVSLTLDASLVASSIRSDPNGQISDLLLGPAGPDQTAETSTYEAWRGLLNTQTVTRGPTTLLDLSYNRAGFNSQTAVTTGQVTHCTNHLDPTRSLSYGYDALARLTSLAAGPADASNWTQGYAYDAYGNRTGVQASGQSGLGTPMPPDGWSTTAYDPASNQVDQTNVSYDAGGNQVTGPRPGSPGDELRYQYDAAGRLVVVRDASGTTLSTYVYGACPRRRARRHGESGPVFYSVWDGDIVIAEYSNDSLSVRPRWLSRSVLLRSRVLASQYPGIAGDLDIRTVYLHPGLTGTLARTTSSQTRNLEVLPYGTVLDDGGDAAHAFTTYDRDPSCGLDYAVHRFYDPGAGRFLQPDPEHIALLGSAGFGLDNDYAYVGGDPANRVDAFGLEDCQKDPVTGECIFTTTIHGSREVPNPQAHSANWGGADTDLAFSSAPTAGGGGEGTGRAPSNARTRALIKTFLQRSTGRGCQAQLDAAWRAAAAARTADDPHSLDLDLTSADHYLYNRWLGSGGTIIPGFLMARAMVGITLGYEGLKVTGAMLWRSGPTDISEPSLHALLWGLQGAVDSRTLPFNASADCTPP